jgi:hypothetical protein
MPFLSKEERKLVKEFLNDVMTDADVADQFNKSSARQQRVQSDYTEMMLRQYMGILKEISDERGNRKPPEAEARSPDFESLKKKYLGPKRK